MSQAEYHAWLFQVATGWLGWSPAETFAATIPEILLAHRGRSDLLAAIFGKPKADEQPRRWRDVKPGTFSGILAKMARRS